MELIEKANELISPNKLLLSKNPLQGQHANVNCRIYVYALNSWQPISADFINLTLDMNPAREVPTIEEVAHSIHEFDISGDIEVSVNAEEFDRLTRIFAEPEVEDYGPH